jgi:hypothetical protein
VLNPFVAQMQQQLQLWFVELFAAGLLAALALELSALVLLSCLVKETQSQNSIYYTSF